MDNTREALRRRLGRMAWLLDSAIQIPGTRFRIGLDAIVGLVPGFGDIVGVLLSSYIVREAARAGAPTSVLLHMAWNVAVEGVVGMIPFAGDVFDAAWKANQRNVALLEAHSREPQRTERSSTLVVTLVIVGLVVFLVFVAFLGFLIARAVWQAIAG